MSKASGPPKCKICGEEHWSPVCTKYLNKVRVLPPLQKAVALLPKPTQDDLVKASKAKAAALAKPLLIREANIINEIMNGTLDVSGLETRAKKKRTDSLMAALSQNKLVSDAKVLRAASKKKPTASQKVKARKEYLRLKAIEGRAAKKAGLTREKYRESLKP